MDIRFDEPAAHRSRAAIASAGALIALIVAIIALLPASLGAQQGGYVAGTVTTQADSAIVSAVVRLMGSQLAAVTDAEGRFRIGPVGSGTYSIEVSAVGYDTESVQTTVSGGSTAQVRITLSPEPLQLNGIRVSVLGSGMAVESRISAREAIEANPRDVGDVLRTQPGLDAVRRGPLGLDPVVRGLRETEVGVYLDGTRQFPAGPARMDSPLTHLDPSALRSVEVVKGPYALTWGAGNMSAIRVQTPPVPPVTSGPWHGRLLTGYDSNLNATETAASLSGEKDAVSWWLHGAWRQGDDYETGAGDVVPGDFESGEIRGSLGVATGDHSTLTLSGGYQDQGRIDYPGRLLNAQFFHASNMSVRWDRSDPAGRFRETQALLYYNNVDHMMDNAGKPTAEPNPDRMPPFPLDVTVDASVSVAGGRIATTLRPSPDVEIELGGDIYSANRDAVRHIANGDNGTELFVDLMWPDATILDAGAFVRAARSVGAWSLAATVRGDYASASADTVSQFFRDNVGTDPDATEFNLSGAFTVGYHPDEHWSLSAGVGSVVRTADATERYSDRVPASKAQTSAEFMGNPSLDPERSTQLDVWIDAAYPRVSLSVNAFVRRLDNYITIDSTGLPKRLPLSPPTVYQYVNGEASFSGVDATVAWSLTNTFTTTISGSLLKGEDRTLNEPALGVSPSSGTVGLRWDNGSGRYLAGRIRAVADQDSVASRRGETRTGGYGTADIQGGLPLGRGLLLRAGVRNITDRAYVDHLNAKNPFNGQQIGEPGRVFWARLSFAF